MWQGNALDTQWHWKLVLTLLFVCFADSRADGELEGNVYGSMEIWRRRWDEMLARNCLAAVGNDKTSQKMQWELLPFKYLHAVLIYIDTCQKCFIYIFESISYKKLTEMCTFASVCMQWYIRIMAEAFTSSSSCTAADVKGALRCFYDTSLHNIIQTHVHMWTYRYVALAKLTVTCV